MNYITKLVYFLHVVFVGLFITSCKGASNGFAPSPELRAPSISALSISPTSVSVAVNNIQSFSGSGGSPPYSYSIFSGTGSILSTTGSLTAPGVSGSTVVRITDSLGQVADAVVTINPALQISPTNPSLSVNATQTFTASGGVSPYVYSRVAGTGSVNASTGAYTAPATSGSATIRVTDSRGNTSDTNVNVFSVLGISPSTVELAVNNVQTFSAAGGTSPYTFSVFSGVGSINPSTGVYTAPAGAGTAVVRVTDNLGATADASITINAALAISPASQTTLINSTISFSGSGGVTPYTFSMVSGTGSINGTTGVYSAPGSNGSAVVRVTDSFGNIANANVTVTSALSISPPSSTLAVNNTRTFTGVGGTAPYTYSRVSGTGNINATTGVYTAPASSGSAVVRVTDSLGATADASITVNAALAINPSSATITVSVGSINYSSSGGVVPYTYSVVGGGAGGSVNATTGVYTAPASTGTDVVRVTDAYGNTSDSNVNIVNGLGISPAAVTLAVNNTFTFSGLGGSTPYTFSVVSGGGSINATTGFYTAPAVAGSVVVRVTDSLSATADANITVNPALAISPATKSLAVNNTFTFTASGGVSPYTFSVVAGGGSINSSTGAYTAPAVAGSATVRVTDGLGNTSNSTVTINAALAISPSSATISDTGTQAYSATGGVSPYTYSILSGPGTINSTTGLYSASTAGSVTVRVTDSLGNTSNGSLTITGALSVSPMTAYVVTGSDLSLSPTGGVAPYSFSIFSGGGTIDTVTGDYTAPAVTGTATLRTTDSAAATVDTSVTIYDPLTLSPMTLTIAANGTQTFTSTGGVGARTFSVSSGSGTIDPSTGAYTAPSVAGTDVIQVTDTIGNAVVATVTIVSQLSITPPTLKLPVFSTMTFGAILGSSPYTFSIFAGTGTVNSTTGLYTAPSVVGTGTVRVTDSITNTSDAAVTHIEPLEIAAGANHNCVRYNDGSVKCWGDGAFGQLGHGSTTDLADVATELGGNLPFVNLGTGRTATALTAGIGHTCALLDNATVKCWGQNTYGQLGIGSTAARGDGANEMGDSLPAVNLGTGRTATKIFAIGYSTCAILDNAATKCWGRNSSGQLGLDDIVNRGTTGTQMGDNLTAVNFGAGRTATKLTGGQDFTCALLDNATVKCFGANRYGQLGTEDTVVRGDSAGDMAALAAINVGTGRTVTNIGAGISHACAILDNATAKCWGRNFRGQLGIENTANIFGDDVGEMGDGLPAIPFTSFAPAHIFGGNQMTCAINSSGGVRCWGQGTAGQLLVGSTANLGDGNNEISGLSNVNLGTSVVASTISVGYFHVCGIMTNKRIKCWGGAANGALGNGTITPNIGDAVGETGNGLPYVNH